MYCNALAKRKEGSAGVSDPAGGDFHTHKLCHRHHLLAARATGHRPHKYPVITCSSSKSASHIHAEPAHLPALCYLQSWAQYLHMRLMDSCGGCLNRVEPDALSGVGLVVVLAVWFSAVVTSNVLPGVLLLGLLIAWSAAVDPPDIDPPPLGSWPAAAALLGAAAVSWWNLTQFRVGQAGRHAKRQVFGLGDGLGAGGLVAKVMRSSRARGKQYTQQIGDLTNQLKQVQQQTAKLEAAEERLQEALLHEQALFQDQLKNKDVEMAELRTKLESTQLQLKGFEQVHEQELKALKTDIRIKDQQLQSLVKSSGQQSELMLKLEAQAAANAKLRGTMNTFEKQMVVLRNSLKDTKLKQVKAELLNTTYENQIKDLQQEVARLKHERTVLVDQMQDLYRHSIGLVKAHANGTKH